MNKITRVGISIFLCLFCPNYYKNMPKKDEKGNWVSAAIRTTVFGTRREIFTKEVSSLIDAYIWARWLALKLDYQTPYAEGEIGVEWEVRIKI